MSERPEFDGETYDPRRDGPRLHPQFERVKTLMLDGQWRTLEQICEATESKSIASVSARLRDLRKEKFGGYTVEREHVGDGVWRYRVAVSRPSFMDVDGDEPDPDPDAVWQETFL